MNVLGTGTAATLSSKLAGVDFSPILDGVLDMVPIAVPVVLGFIAFKKGYSFVMGKIKGA